MTDNEKRDGKGRAREAVSMTVEWKLVSLWQTEQILYFCILVQH